MGKTGTPDKTGNFVKQHEESIDFPVNESQLRAIKLGLENKIALIQGPPGICDFFCNY